MYDINSLLACSFQITKALGCKPAQIILQSNRVGGSAERFHPSIESEDTKITILTFGFECTKIHYSIKVEKLLPKFKIWTSKDHINATAICIWGKVCVCVMSIIHVFQ